MEMEGLEIVRLELKYCERCGGLWMRTWGTDEIYCPTCALEMSDMPPVRRRARSFLLVDDRVEIKSECESPGHLGFPLRMLSPSLAKGLKLAIRLQVCRMQIL